MFFNYSAIVCVFAVLSLSACTGSGDNLTQASQDSQTQGTGGNGSGGSGSGGSGGSGTTTIQYETPTITSVIDQANNMNAGPLSGGTALVTGTYFLSGMTVTIGSSTCSNVTLVTNSTTQLTCTLPTSTAAGATPGVAVSASVTTTGGTATLSSAYTYEAAPTVSGLSVSTVSTLGGTSLTITGTGFLSGATVTVDGVSCPVTGMSGGTSITCTVPGQDPGTTNVVVTNTDQQGSATSSSSSVTYASSPVITTILPPQGSNAGGTTLTLLGSGFQSGMTVTIGSISCTVTVSSSHLATCSTGSTTQTGLMNVVVANPANSLSTTLTKAFTYNASGGSNISYYDVSLFASNYSPSGSEDSAPAQLAEPQGIAVDTSSGHPYIYIADSMNGTIRRWNYDTNVMITISGTVGTPGVCTATTPYSMQNPSGLWLDSTNQLLVVTDFGCSAVWVLNVGSIASSQSEPGTPIAPALLAGTGAEGHANGAGSVSTFLLPNSIVYNSSNSTFYLTDSGNNLIRTIIKGSGNSASPWYSGSGSTTVLTTVATLAGGGSGGTQGGYQNGTGTGSGGALFNVPEGLVLYSGTLYVADSGNYAIRAVSTSGTASLFAGTPNTSNYTDGAATSAAFSWPVGLGVSGTDIYVTDNHKIRMISMGQSGFPVSTIAGSWNYGNLDGTGANALFWSPYGLGFDSSANVYISDYKNHNVRMIPSGETTTSTIMGSTANTTGFQNGSGTLVGFHEPDALYTDAQNLYIGDYWDCSIRIASPTTGQVSSFAGTGICASAAPSGAIGGASPAAIGFPAAIASDGASMFVSDNKDHVILKIDLATQTVSVVAGGWGTSGSNSGTVAGSAARFNAPSGLYLYNGTLYIADSGNNQIRQMSTTSPYNVSTFASVANSPIGIAFDGTQFYVLAGCVIQTMSTSGTLGSFAGSTSAAGQCYDLNNSGTSARLGATYINSMMTDGVNLYVADDQGSRIQQMPLTSNPAVTTLLGNAVSSFGKNVSLGLDLDNNSITTAMTYRPHAITFLQGQIFFANPYNIRTIR